MLSNIYYGLYEVRTYPVYGWYIQLRKHFVRLSAHFQLHSPNFSSWE